MRQTSTRNLGRFVRRDRNGRRRWWRLSRAWLSSVATQALAQALGTLLAAGVLVLGAVAVGQVQGLSTRAIITISIGIVALAALLVAGASLYTSAAELYEGRKAEELLQRSLEEMKEQTAQREAEIREMQKRGDL